jgi:1-acyl-sn-glycerol-3-phosphate acyltransferase
LIPTIAVYTIVLGLASITSSFFDRRGHFAHGCARAWSWLILATTGVEVSVTGLDRLEPGRTYVFVANHQSIYDIPCLFWSIPYQLRIIAKDSLGRFPVLGPHLKRTGHMLVDRSKPDRAGIVGWASRLTSNGLSLIIFPEGTRSRTGMLGKFKGGSIMLAMQAGLPLVSDFRDWQPSCDEKGRADNEAGVRAADRARADRDRGGRTPIDARRARSGRSRARSHPAGGRSRSGQSNSLSAPSRMEQQLHSINACLTPLRISARLPPFVTVSCRCSQ